MKPPDPATLLPARAFRERPELDARERLAHFLAEYWQQRSLFMPGALADFEAPLDGDELAGLACEDGADARIIRRESDRFIPETGPFPEQRFAGLGERDWTLLVNGVDLEIPGFEPLLAMLRFVPEWRVDDVMVSFAAPGGSAGPHFDHYDVFLVQLDGRRRWELGPGAEHSVTCNPGDVLYVPPGLTHHGIAETACLTASLGLRAPSAADLLAAWAAESISELPTTPLNLDPPLPAVPAQLAPETIDRARQALRRALLEQLDAGSDSDFARWLGRVLTRPGRSGLLEPPEPVTAAALDDLLRCGARLERLPGARWLLHEDAAGRTLCVGGEVFPAERIDPEQLAPLLTPTPLRAADLADPAVFALAVELYNAGWLVMDEAGAERA